MINATKVAWRLTVSGLMELVNGTAATPIISANTTTPSPPRTQAVCQWGAPTKCGPRDPTSPMEAVSTGASRAAQLFTYKKVISTLQPFYPIDSKHVETGVNYKLTVDPMGTDLMDSTHAFHAAAPAISEIFSKSSKLS